MFTDEVIDETYGVAVQFDEEEEVSFYYCVYNIDGNFYGSNYGGDNYCDDENIVMVLFVIMMMTLMVIVTTVVQIFNSGSNGMKSDELLSIILISFLIFTGRERL